VRPPVKGDPKQKPQYSTEITDPQLKTISDQFLALSKRKNITFLNKVSIGFTKIEDRTETTSTIGTCSSRRDFREIDIDKDFWNRSSWLSKVALLYHELAHCYCRRDHDYDNGTMYPDGSLKAILQGWIAKQPITPIRPEGYLADGCPKSIMHPIMGSDYCFEKHYEYYTEEMFARCEPW